MRTIRSLWQRLRGLPQKHPEPTSRTMNPPQAYTESPITHTPVPHITIIEPEKNAKKRRRNADFDFYAAKLLLVTQDMSDFVEELNARGMNREADRVDGWIDNLIEAGTGMGIA
jgi:hypothetical protein